MNSTAPSEQGCHRALKYNEVVFLGLRAKFNLIIKNKILDKL